MTQRKRRPIQDVAAQLAEDNFPYHMREHIENDYPTGGRSMLHKENGVPHVRDERVFIKARKDEQRLPPLPMRKRGLHDNQIPSVGNHDDHKWYSPEVSGYADDEDYVDADSLQGANPLEQEVYAEQPPQQKQASRSFTSPRHNEYILYVGNKEVSRGFNPAHILETVEDLIFNHHVNLDEIYLMKRIMINFGAHIEEQK